MLACDRKLLEDEIDRVYDEHYSSCNTKAVHDFYRAVIRRVRRYSLNLNPEIVRVRLYRADAYNRWVLTASFILFGHYFETKIRLPKEICDDNCLYLEVTK